MASMDGEAITKQRNILASGGIRRPHLVNRTVTSFDENYSAVWEHHRHANQALSKGLFTPEKSLKTVSKQGFIGVCVCVCVCESAHVHSKGDDELVTSTCKRLIAKTGHNLL